MPTQIFTKPFPGIPKRVEVFHFLLKRSARRNHPPFGLDNVGKMRTIHATRYWEASRASVAARGGQILRVPGFEGRRFPANSKTLCASSSLVGLCSLSKGDKATSSQDTVDARQLIAHHMKALWFKWPCPACPTSVSCLQDDDGGLVLLEKLELPQIGLPLEPAAHSRLENTHRALTKRDGDGTRGAHMSEENISSKHPMDGRCRTFASSGGGGRETPCALHTPAIWPARHGRETMHGAQAGRLETKRR